MAEQKPDTRKKFVLVGVSIVVLALLLVIGVYIFTNDSIRPGQSVFYDESQTTNIQSEVQTSTLESQTQPSSTAVSPVSQRRELKFTRQEEFGMETLDLNTADSNNCLEFKRYTFPKDTREYNESAYIAPRFNNSPSPDELQRLIRESETISLLPLDYFSNSNTECGYRGLGLSVLSLYNLEFEMRNAEFARPFFFQQSSGAGYSDAQVGIIGITENNVFLLLDDDSMLDFSPLVMECGARDFEGKPTGAMIFFGEGQYENCYKPKERELISQSDEILLDKANRLAALFAIAD